MTASRSVWLALAAVGAVAAAAGYAVNRASTPSQPGLFSGAVTVYAYNFTPYSIDYSLTPGLSRGLRADSARGNDVQGFGYKPASADAPMKILWRYASGPQAAPQGDYPFQVTLAQPRRPEGEVVLELRIYPDGKAAARYVKMPLVSDFSNVSPELPGNDWVTNR